MIYPFTNLIKLVFLKIFLSKILTIEKIDVDKTITV